MYWMSTYILQKTYCKYFQYHVFYLICGNIYSICWSFVNNFFFIFCKLKHSMLGWQARFLSLSLLLISLFAGWCLVASSHQHFSFSLFLFKFWFLILGFEVLPLKFVYVCACVCCIRAWTTTTSLFYFFGHYVVSEIVGHFLGKISKYFLTVCYGT